MLGSVLFGFILGLVTEPVTGYGINTWQWWAIVVPLILIFTVLSRLEALAR